MPNDVGTKRNGTKDAKITTDTTNFQSAANEAKSVKVRAESRMSVEKVANCNKVSQDKEKMKS